VWLSSPARGGNPNAVSEDHQVAGEVVRWSDWLRAKRRTCWMSSIAASEPISRAMESSTNANHTSRLSLIAGLSGIIFVVLLVGPLFVFGLGPSPTSGPGDVAGYYAQHAGVLQTIQVLRASSTLFFLLFLAVLAELVRRQARFTALPAGVLAAGVTVAGIDAVLYAARLA